MEAVGLQVEVPGAKGPIENALDCAREFFAGSPEVARSAEEFWDYLRATAGFRCAGFDGDATDTEAARLKGVEFAEDILGRAEGIGICEKVANEEKWLYHAPEAAD